MDTNTQKYILLNDTVGEQLDIGWLLPKKIPTQLLRGEIFQALPKSEQPNDLEKIALTCTDSSLHIQLVCHTLDVSKLTDCEADLLLAISTTEKTFRIHQERDRLEWAKTLNVGSRVYVNKELQGIICYKGCLPGHRGTMFGVELLGEESEGLGTCDGTFKGKNYFDCPQEQGVFVAMDELCPNPHDQAPKKESTFLSMIRDMIPSFSSKDSSESSIRNIAKDHKIKIDQRVVVFQEDEPLRGTVRYISKNVDKDGDCPVGIELEKRKGNGTGVFKGRQRFVCPKDYALFAPVTSLIPEQDFDGAPTENPQNTSSSETNGSTLGYNDNAVKRLSSSDQIALDFEEYQLPLPVWSLPRAESEPRLSSSELRSHDLEAQLYPTEQISHQHQLSLDTKKQTTEELEARLRSSEQRLRELELSLETERQAREQSERRLRTSELRSHDFESQLHNTEERLHQLQLSLDTERQAREETEQSLRSLDQRSRELHTSLATERQAHEDTVGRLRVSEQRVDEFKRCLVDITQENQETESRLQNSEQRYRELETTLTTLRQAYDDCRRSRESTRDWVLLRDEVVLSDTVIGRGAWGEVKEGTFRGCKVAVKEIHQLILSNHNRRLFEREMNMASRCRHPYLLQFIGATNDEQSPLFVTELMDTSLRGVLHERPLEPPEILTIALDVAKGLNYLHLSHPDPIIHRDISSANVLLWKRVDNWRAKVSDYGTANVLQHSMSVCPGAAAYSAPEAQTSRQSPKLDVYSFGILLCEMNIGEMPVEDQRDEQVALVTNNFFRNLIRRCLEQNPEERPSMAEIIEALENSPQ